MAREYRIGVLGMTHDHIWGELPDVARAGATLVAAADVNEPLRDRVQREYGCKVYPEATQLLESEELDAVYVFADNASSVELTELAMGRGLHVMVEKPMANNLAGAERMLRAARDSGKLLMVNWPFAWWPQLQHALELARTGAIGRVWEVKYRSAHIGPRDLGCSPYFCQWLYDERLNGGGAYADYTCYGCVLARTLIGLPREVMGWRSRLVKSDIDVDDNGVIVMIYPDAMAISEGSWTQVDDMTNYRPHIYGTEATLLLEPRRDGRIWKATRSVPNGERLSPPPPPPHMANATAHFLWAIETGGPLSPLCDPVNCRDAQEIMEAGLLSAAGGRRVTLPLSPAAESRLEIEI